MAAIEYRGLNAVTNFDLSRYIKWLRPTTNQDNPNPNNNFQPNPNGDLNNSSTPNPNPNPNPHLGLMRLSANGGPAVVTPRDGGGGGGASPSSALGLLLQSTKFKEMLERTSTGADTPPESEPPRRSFPEDIQTYFDCHDSTSFTEGDDILFGDLGNTFASVPNNFHCEDWMHRGEN